MNGGDDAAQEVVGFVACRDPHIAGHAGREGMNRRVQPAMGEIEADTAGQRLADLRLDFIGERAGQGSFARRALPLFRDALHKLRQEFLEIVKHGIDDRGTRTGLVFIEKRVVGRKAQRICLGVRSFDLPVEKRFQRGHI
jgi:hypothetical protein